MTARLPAVLLVLAAAPAVAHRLDEYLQATLLSVEKDRVEAQMTLTPGVAVLPLVLASVDTDGNGAISEAEQRAYAGRVLADLSLTAGGRRLTPRLLAIRFPTIAQMREGMGEIRLDFRVELPHGSGNRKLTLENHHLSRIAAYQVNCLVPRDPDIRIVAQNRNYLQSHYELDYAQAGLPQRLLGRAWWGSDSGWLAGVALLLLARFAFLWRQRGRTAHAPRVPIHPLAIRMHSSFPEKGGPCF